MTDKDLEILKYLREQKDWVGPTQIGLYFGKKYTVASSWCSANLKRLVKGGFIESNKGKYRVVSIFNKNLK